MIRNIISRIAIKGNYPFFDPSRACVSWAILLILCLFYPSAIGAAVDDVRGYITENNQPVGDAIIEVYYNGQQILDDVSRSTGYFALKTLETPAGSHRFVVKTVDEREFSDSRYLGNGDNN